MWCSLSNRRKVPARVSTTAAPPLPLFAAASKFRRPNWLLLGFDPERIAPRIRFGLLGAGAGALGPLIGATGPFIAPFFLGIGLTRFQLIGTKAACQAALHLAKMILFGLAGFAFGDYALLMAAMARHSPQNFSISLFGIVSAVTFFLPGLKYYRQQRKGGNRASS